MMFRSRSMVGHAALTRTMFGSNPASGVWVGLLMIRCWSPKPENACSNRVRPAWVRSLIGRASGCEPERLEFDSPRTLFGEALGMWRAQLAVTQSCKSCGGSTPPLPTLREYSLVVKPLTFNQVTGVRFTVLPLYGSIAQWIEQQTLNLQVEGSNPSTPTMRN